MNLQCGHQLHTNCFIEYLYMGHGHLLRFECPVCHVHALENTMVEWLQENDTIHFAQPETVERLWNENNGFREDIRNLHKLQRGESSAIRTHKKELAQLMREWKETTYTSFQFLKEQKRIFKRRLFSLGGRKRAIRGANKILAERRKILNKYPSLSWISFRNVRAIAGAPKLTQYQRTLLWKLMPYGLFRIRV